MLVADEQHETRRQCGSIAQLGEHLPYKQGVTGSSPVVPTKFWPGSSVGQNASLSRQRSSVRTRSGSPKFASVAQSVEQGTENPRVGGSIPPGGTIHIFLICEYNNNMLCGSGSVVERHLAKVNVASSNLVFRSKGHTAVCPFCFIAEFVLYWRIWI